jgi:predicted TIM-barrel fold metal-dependent hydrolase
VRLCDAHLHFFSKGVLGFYARQVEALRDQADPAAAAAGQLGIEAPPAEPEALAARWIAELDRHDVSRAALFGSAPGEAMAVSRAARAFPERLVPLQMLNARSADATAIKRDFGERGIKGILLFPAMHSYFPDEPVCRPIYEAAQQQELVLFVHLGRLRIAIKDRLGIGGGTDDRYGDPAHLAPILRQFPDVRFIVPHFGGGTLAELLPAMDGIRNLYLDTSSSNSWIGETASYPSLETVLSTVLEHPSLGPERILFGSDSTVFPRGFRTDVYERTLGALDAIGAPSADRERIFGGNFEDLFPFSG